MDVYEQFGSLRAKLLAYPLDQPVQFQPGICGMLTPDSLQQFFVRAGHPFIALLSVPTGHVRKEPVF